MVILVMDKKIKKNHLSINKLGLCITTFLHRLLNSYKKIYIRPLISSTHNLINSHLNKE